MPPPVGTATRLKNMGTRRLVIGHIRLSPLIGDCFDVWGSAVGGVELGYRLFGERLQAVMAQPLAQAERWYGGPTRVGLVSLVRRQSLRWAQERHTAVHFGSRLRRVRRADCSGLSQGLVDGALGAGEA
jgi:hypothetical protein